MYDPVCLAVHNHSKTVHVHVVHHLSMTDWTRFSFITFHGMSTSCRKCSQADSLQR